MAQISPPAVGAHTNSAALAQQVAVADAATGTTLQAGRAAVDDVGRPARPDLEDRAKLERLTRPERAGVELPEERQLAPERSTDAVIAHQGEAWRFAA